MNPKQRSTWVIYEAQPLGEPKPGKAVCTQAEWEHMQLRQPGPCRLIQAGILSEAEAEKMIRAQSVAAEANNPPAPRSTPTSAHTGWQLPSRPWYRGFAGTQS